MLETREEMILISKKELKHLYKKIKEYEAILCKAILKTDTPVKMTPKTIKK